MTATTRGPLSAGVYWRRRLFVLGLLAALLFVLVSLVRGGGHDPARHAATTTAATTHEPGTQPGTEPGTEPGTVTGGERSDSTSTTSGPGTGSEGSDGSQDPTPPASLAEPDGTCEDRDVSVVPSVDEAVAGQPVTIRLLLRTLRSPACTWRVSSKHVAVKITDGSTPIWSSQQCRFGIPQADVVVRKAVSTTVEMTWRARESEPGCPRNTDWVLPGDFTITAASLGGEPATDTFDLTRPEAPATTLPPRTTPDLKGKQDKNKKHKKDPKAG